VQSCYSVEIMGMRKGLKMNGGSASIKGMNSYIFNKELNRYEQVQGFLTGKSSVQIAEEHNLSTARTRQYALENKLPYLGDDGKVFVYVYDAAAEQEFINRKVKPGPKATEKPPKVPGKPGRPRKEKPANTAPKKSVGRPRKNPVEKSRRIKREKKKRGKQ
jgi:hypothetical protein